jgi:hypothetical protein
MVGLLLIVQVPDSGNERSMPLSFRPIDRFALRPESNEHLVGVVFHDIVIDRTAIRSALGASLNVNVGHSLSSPRLFRSRAEYKHPYAYC